MKGVIATGHPLVTEAAARLLREGGNAFDAVAAAGFAASVVEPGLTNLGGGGYLLARPSSREPIVFDFFVDTPGRGLPQRALEPHFFPVTVRFPASEQEFNVGLGSAAVPGTLKGLVHIQRRLGRRSLAQVVAPAIALARDGVVLTELQAYVLELLTPIMALQEDGRRIYTRAGRSLRAGETLTNPELARFLEALPEDQGESFYQGGDARRIAADMREGGGLVTASDLASYQVIERAPLEAEYRGHTLLTNPPPALGGSLIALATSLLEGRDFARAARGSAAHLSSLAETMMEVEHRRQLVGVPSVQRGTTHASIYDSEGNIASMTTSNGEGSGYIVPGTGVMLNNMLGEEDLHPDGFHASPPGERVSSMMSPSILLANGDPRLVLGSGGSKRIRTALMQVLSNCVDFGAGVREAVEAPRLHWDGAVLQVEPGFEPASLRALRERWEVNEWPEPNLYFGGVHAVSPQGEAVGDFRRGGAGCVVE